MKNPLLNKPLTGAYNDSAKNSKRTPPDEADKKCYEKETTIELLKSRYYSNQQYY